MRKQNQNMAFLSLIVVGSCGLVWGNDKPVQAATIALQPHNTFEVIDGGWSGNFDGLGDEIFPGNFDTVVRGTIGESAEFAEFDLQNFQLLPNEKIVSATFQTQIFSFQTFGLGVGFQNPGSLGIYGYLGNGKTDASDLEAGTLLNTVDISSALAGDILTFDITNFIQKLVHNKNDFAGLGIRAQNLGALTLGGANFPGMIPNVTIITEPSKPPTSIPESSTTLSVTLMGGLLFTLRKKLK